MTLKEILSSVRIYFLSLPQWVLFQKSYYFVILCVGVHVSVGIHVPQYACTRQRMTLGVSLDSLCWRYFYVIVCHIICHSTYLKLLMLLLPLFPNFPSDCWHYRYILQLLPLCRYGHTNSDSHHSTTSILPATLFLPLQKLIFIIIKLLCLKN